MIQAVLISSAMGLESDFEHLARFHVPRRGSSLTLASKSNSPTHAWKLKKFEITNPPTGNDSSWVKVSFGKLYMKVSVPKIAAWPLGLWYPPKVKTSSLDNASSDLAYNQFGRVGPSCQAVPSKMKLWSVPPSLNNNELKHDFETWAL